MGNKKTVKTNNPAGAKIKAASEAIRKNVENSIGAGVKTTPQSPKVTAPLTQGSHSSAAATRQGKALEDTAKKYGTNAAAMATALSNIAGSFQRAGVMDKRVSQNGDNSWNSSPYNEDTKIRMGVYGHPDKDDYSDDDIAKMTVSVLNAQKTGSANRSLQEKTLKNALDVYKNRRGALPRGYDGLYEYLSKGYTPSRGSHGDGSVIRNFSKQEQESTEKLKKAGTLEWLGKSAASGLSGFNSSLAKGLDLVMPTDFLGKYDPFSKLNDYYSAQNEAWSQSAQEAAQSRGSAYEFITNNLIAPTVQALPQAVVAMMTGGMSEAASLGGAASALPDFVSAMVKNPSYWLSFLTTAGNEYEEAKRNGANDFTASAAAVLSSLINAGVEVGGGIDTLPGNVKSGGKSAIMHWVDSMIDEGREEVVQGIVSQSMAKLMYDHDKEVLSFTNEDAVVNPVRAAKEFAGGAAVGGLLGGGQILADKAFESVKAVKNPILERVSAENSSGVSDGGKFSIAYTDKNEPVAVLNSNVFYDEYGNKKEGKAHKIIEDFIADQIGNKFKIEESGQWVYIGDDLPGEYTQSEYTKKFLQKKKSLLKVKHQSSQNFKEIIEIASNRHWSKNAKSKHIVDAKYGFYKYSSKVALPVKNSSGDVVGSNVYDIELLIRNDADGKKYLYDIQNIRKNTNSVLASTQIFESAIKNQNGVLSKNSIPQNSKFDNKNITENVGADLGELHSNRSLNEIRWEIGKNKITRRELIATNNVARLFDVDVVFVNNLTDDDGTVLNGEYSADGKTIKINANSADPLFTTLLHESVHALKRGNPESFAVLSSELKSVARTNTSEFSKAFKAVQRSYTKQMTNDAAINKEIVDEEFTSFMLSYLLDNPQTLKSLARKNMNTVQKIADSVLGWFDGSIERYKNMDTSYQGTLSDAVQKLQDKRKEFAKIFGQASDGYYRDGADVSYGNKNLYAGKNADNIDVFVTDSSLKALSYDERKNIFLDLIKNEYSGRTARFERNGHIYYAQFSDDDIRKNIFGDKKSDKKGWKAKINIGASGDIFDLFETLDYSHYSLDDGQKRIKAHKDLYGWYYFVKNVQIDNVVYDVIANVRLSKDGQYIYSLQLNRNKKRKASPPLRNMKSIPSKTGAQHSSLNSISQKQNFDNENITENVGNSLANVHNAENTPSVSGGDIGRNSTAYRVYAQARSRYGLENVEDYSDVSFARADIDARNGREFRFEDNTASSAIKDKYSNSLHLSDNIVFERGDGANVEYGTGRILQFDEGGNVIIAVDSGGGYANTITLPHEKVTFVSHNNESTISQDFRTSHPMYERAKGSFDNFVRANLRKIKSASASEQIIDLSNDNVLSFKIKGMRGSEKYKAIREHILDVLGDQSITLSDGIVAFVDKSDALHIANKSANKKTAYISNIRKIIEQAHLYGITGMVEHNKFESFRYYRSFVKFGEDVYPVYLNVGYSKNGDGYHIYDITQKIGATAKQNIALERVNNDLRSEISSPISNNIISQNHEFGNKKFDGAQSDEDIFPGFTFGDADYYLSQCSERMKLLLSTLDRMGRADSGLDPYFKYRSTEKDSNPFDVDDMSKNHILLELYDAVANYNLAKDIADVYIASGESLVDFDVLVDSLKDISVIFEGNYNFKSYRDVFQKVFRNNYDAVSPLLDSFDRAKGKYSHNLKHNDASIKEMCKKYGFKPCDDFDRAIQWYGEKNIHFDLTKAKDRKLFKKLGFDRVGYEYSDEIDVAFDYRDLVERFGEARAAQIAECAEFFRKAYDDYLVKVNDTIARIYPGQTDRLIKPRKDYFRHFRDIGDDLFSLGFALAEDAEIDPQLAGVSSRTKPKSAWASYRQERETKITDYSAVQGFYDYMQQAEYTINIDPFIKEFRMMRQVLAKRKSEMGQTNLSDFLRWLDNFANLLAKKTPGADRMLTDGALGNIGGRKILKGARILNNAAKTNQVVRNFAVALKQGLNLKNSIFFLQKPSLQLNAVLGLLKAKLYDSALMEKYEALMEKSNYLAERYLDLSFGENKSWTWKQSMKMLSFLDEFATRSVWLAAYEDGRRLKVPDPVIYADDITRRCSAGRGIGEKPLAFEAVSTNFFLSYLLENNNNWNIWRDILHNTVKAPRGGHEFSDKNSYLYYRNQKSGARKAGSMTYRMLLFMIMTTAVGDLLEELTGFRAEFDPINDAVKSFKASRDENGELDMKKFALELGKNVGLDFAGHRNFSGIYASALSWISDDPLLANNEFFGGVPAISVLSNTAKRAVDGDWLGAGLEFGSGFLMRGGGAQLKKSIKGIADVAQGAHYNEPVTKSLVTGEKGGRAYDAEQSAENYVKGALFGSSALREAREYWDSKAEKAAASKDAASMREEDFESYKAQARKSAKTDKLSAELWRVMNETGSDSALAYNYIDPVQTYADKYGNEQSFELGEKERAMYQNEQNRLIKQKYAEVVQTEEYKNADDAGKLGLLQKARKTVVTDYAEKVAADYVMKPMIDDYIAAHGEDDVVKLWKKTGDYDLLPVHDTARDKSYEFNGERFSFELSDEQIDQYNAQNSEEIGKAYQKLMSSHRWKLLSDEKKADELRAAKKSATEVVSERVKWDHVYADAMAEFDARYGEDNPVRRAYEYSHDATVYPYWVLDDSFDFTYNKVKYRYDMSHDDGSYRGGVEYDALSEAYIKQFSDNYENAVVGNSAAAARLAAKSDAEIYELLTKFKGNIINQANELLKNYIIAKAKAGAADAQLKIKE